MDFDRIKYIALSLLVVVVMGVIVVDVASSSDPLLVENQELVAAGEVLGVQAAPTEENLDIPAVNLGQKIFLTSLDRYFDVEELLSLAVYVEYRDANGRQVLFEREGQAERPLASLTKTMTAITAMQNADLVDTVFVSQDAIGQEGDQQLATGMRVPLMQAINFLMQSSSNDMAYAVQESVSSALLGKNNADEMSVVNTFVRAMNDQARSIGLEHSFFVDAVGFDESERLSGSYGSPSDVARLLWEVIDLYPEVANGSIQSTDSYSFGGKEIIINNTNPLLKKENTLLFSKTGFTDLAGGNLALVSDLGGGKKAAIVTMGSTYEGRFKDAEIILKALEQWLEFNF